MNVSQPTVSRRVKALGRILGGDLMVRGQRPLNLTLNGEACYFSGERFVRIWIEFWASPASS